MALVLVEMDAQKCAFQNYYMNKSNLPVYPLYPSLIAIYLNIEQHSRRCHHKLNLSQSFSIRICWTRYKLMSKTAPYESVFILKLSQPKQQHNITTTQPQHCSWIGHKNDCANPTAPTTETQQ